MFELNTLPDYRQPLEKADRLALQCKPNPDLDTFLRLSGGGDPTPLHSLRALAAHLDVAAIHVKDEGFRLGMGSFKALGGGYAVARMILEEASLRLTRTVTFDELQTPAVEAVARTMTFACATDGNHGRSVAMGAARMGAQSAIVVHEGVSGPRVDAIRNAGATIIRVPGTYDDAVAQASRLCAECGWRLVSDTSWIGYEHVPLLVMQGYTAIVREIVDALPEPPTHVFLQAGVGGMAAAVAACLADAYGSWAPMTTVVEPDRAACVFRSAAAGKPLKIAATEPTVMAMLECYEPSMVAWRILARLADVFMTVDEQEAIDAMRCFADPCGDDPAIVAGESGGVGLAGLLQVAGRARYRDVIGLDTDSRVLVINTEGATDPLRYEKLLAQVAFS
ncbi:diaminopropionate ammonia-lyase [Luteibacter yeojuensis]|uniref:Diaminopropionate ammonia-lyase n=1 Tax=Luteibacter yeojuensis TaxID=345309 RepID=A0A7X5QSI7_9GAMM|nr:diaminopropionate ammonia-lyase [Luteibacter yeojuensis]NID14589.1 diaminopropionate ammonia-lyase [Luteibacter yeojuensis]